MPINYNIHYLKDNEICGAKSYNPLAKFCLGIRSTSDYLSVNPNGTGSINIELDSASLAEWILSMASDGGLGFTWDFQVSFRKVNNSTRLYVSGGRVLFPTNEVTISGINGESLSTSQDSGKMIYVRLNSKTSGELVLDDAVTHTHQTENDNYRFTLPIATITYSQNEWHPRYHHIGSFAFESYPYFWKSGWDKDDYQFLVHRDGHNEERWESAGDCEDNQ